MHKVAGLSAQPRQNRIVGELAWTAITIPFSRYQTNTNSIIQSRSTQYFKMPSIIDSHVHVWPSSEADTLAWLTPDHPLSGQRSVAEYQSASSSNSPSGFIFIEVDRKNADSTDWTAPLQEIAWTRRLVTGAPSNPDEGFGAADAKLVLGIIPWAPVNLGAAKLDEYLVKAEEKAGPETWAKVKGFRYLLQDKPNGTALGDEFIEGLKVLGKKGFVFDLGVDQHKRGRIQLEEAVEMIDRAHDGVEEDDKVVFILSEFDQCCDERGKANGDRSSLPAGLDHCEPDRPILHCVADSHVYAEQV